jgi:hypothetical protein
MQESEGSQLERALRLQTGRVGFEAVVPNPKIKLVDQVREVLRLRHYSIRTEQSYCDWIRRFIRFPRMQSRAELSPGPQKVEGFLSDLAVNGRVVSATQLPRTPFSAGPMFARFRSCWATMACPAP